MKSKSIISVSKRSLITILYLFCVVSSRASVTINTDDQWGEQDEELKKHKDLKTIQEIRNYSWDKNSIKKKLSKSKKLLSKEKLIRHPGVVSSFELIINDALEYIAQINTVEILEDLYFLNGIEILKVFDPTKIPTASTMPIEECFTQEYLKSINDIHAKYIEPFNNLLTKKYNLVHNIILGINKRPFFETRISFLLSHLQTNLQSYKNKITKLSKKQKAAKSLNTKLYEVSKAYVDRIAAKLPEKDQEKRAFEQCSQGFADARSDTQKSKTLISQCQDLSVSFNRIYYRIFALYLYTIEINKRPIPIETIPSNEIQNNGVPLPESLNPIKNDTSEEQTTIIQEPTTQNNISEPNTNKEITVDQIAANNTDDIVVNDLNENKSIPRDITQVDPIPQSEEQTTIIQELTTQNNSEKIITQNTTSINIHKTNSSPRLTSYNEKTTPEHKNGGKKKNKITVIQQLYNGSKKYYHTPAIFILLISSYLAYYSNTTQLSSLFKTLLSQFVTNRTTT